MKLLFDENLSPDLPRLLATFFPSSAHVRDLGLAVLMQQTSREWRELPRISEEKGRDPARLVRDINQ